MFIASMSSQDQNDLGSFEVLLAAIALLMGLAAASWHIYRSNLRRLFLKIQDSTRQCRQMEARLAEAFGYIGAVNVEFKEIESILCRIERYPQSKRELQQLLNDFVQRAMVIAGSAWVVCRIIDKRNFRTLKEAVQHRAGDPGPSSPISNRSLIEKKAVNGFSLVQTGAKNLPIRTSFVFPVKCLSTQDRILLSAIAGEIEMLFIIFQSGGVRRFQPEV